MTVRLRLVATLLEVRETLNVLGSPTQKYNSYLRCVGTSFKCLGQLGVNNDAMAGIDAVLVLSFVLELDALLP